MLPYWLLFLFWAAAALQYQRSPHRIASTAVFRICIALTTLVVGLRWEVGGDWGNYERIFSEISLLNFHQSFVYTDPAYGILNWIVAQLGFGVVTVNLVCAAIFMWGTSVFAERQANPWLVIAVAVPYFIIVVGMGYTRQATALGLVLVALIATERKGLLWGVLFVTLGALFHRSAALALPLIAAGPLRRNLLLTFIGLIGSGLLYFWVLRSAEDRLIQEYANSQYQASGAAVRLAMNALAGTVFFVYRKKMNFSQFETVFWTICAVLSYASLIGLRALSSSVGVDRLALFLIPLQLAVYSRLPYALSPSWAGNPRVTFAVLVYSAAVLAIYLNYGAMAYRWIPYQMAPFVTDAH